MRHYSTCMCICLSSQLHLRAEGSSETEELQKRVKILQGKLDKQKQQTRELEEALKSTKPALGGASGQVGGATGTSQPLIDSKVSEKGRERERKIYLVLLAPVSRGIEVGRE